MTFADTKAKYQELIETRLAALVSNSDIGDIKPPMIYEAVSYSLLGGGKRLRPMLLLAAFYAVAGNKHDNLSAFKNGASGTPPPTSALDFACAIEMIHTYSLIHDDLPAIDNDDMRRGRPTNHIVYGEAMAILAGDSLLNMAYETMANACVKYQPQRGLAALAEVAHAAGLKGMIGGQVMDVHTEGTPINEETLLYIHRNKTAALIKTAIVAGATLGGADDTQLEKFKAAALDMGIGFQIMDDILDVVGDEISLGKHIGSDAKNGKNTYVSLFGMERAKQDYATIWSRCIAAFEELGATFLADYAKDLQSRVN